MMMLFLAILLVLTCDGVNALVYQDNQVACYPGWIEVNERELHTSKTCIKLQHVKKSWEDARRACQDDSADLVKILTWTMNDEIMYQLSLYEGDSFWFGLRGSLSDRYTWHWLGESRKATNLSWFRFPWSNHRVRICGEINKQSEVRGSWSHGICSDLKKSICQRVPINQIFFFPNEYLMYETCSDGWIKTPSVRRSCIKLFDLELDWEAARAVCRSHGADLVRIDDARMNKFIQYRVSKSFFYSYWVGLKKQANYFYMWVGHYLALYLDWGQGQPNGDGNKTCVAIDERLNRKWALKSCSVQSKFICEKGSFQITFIEKTIGTSITCQAGWVKSPTTGTCFKQYPQSLSWFDAREACRAEDADLVKVLDGKMNKLIKETISSDRFEPHWIGLNDIYEEGSFHWLDEVDKPKYSKLDRPHVPIVDNSQDCVAISPGFRDGRWIDELCEIFVTHPFICEKFPGPSPCLDPDREGWFGHNCRHKCQCDQSANCNKFDGSCARRCAPNRIGPSCQYELMRFSVDPSFAWLRDKSRATCNNEGLDSVRLTLDTAVHVNSIHLDLNDSNQLQNIEVIVNKLSHEYQQECTASGITTLVCNINDVIKEVKLSGSGVRHLCNYQIFEANVNFQVLNKTEAEIAWLNDRYAAATCNDEDKEVLDVTFDRPRKLGWIRFIFKASDSLKNRSMSITSGATAQSFTHQCENPIISESRTLVDVYCPTDHLVNQLYLRGPGVALLCGIRFDNVRVEYSSDGVSSSRFSWLTDYNDKTCNHIDDDVVTVTLDTPIPLTWIRVVLKTETLDRIELRYKTMSSETHVQVCPYAHFAQVSFETFELHCQTPDLVSHLRLVGPAVKDLCSLYISQGRNVALKEAAEQSSTANVSFTDARFAVDGLQENGIALLTSDAIMCTLTDIDTPSWWMVTLSLEAYVHSFQISHQGNDNMRGFSIVVESKTGEQYTYTDNSGPPQPVYTVIPSPKISFRVHTVKIKAREGQPVSLCEVSILGETVCPDGQFGLRCEWACNCLHNFSCLPHSGGCPRGCARGFHGEDCYQPILY